MREMHSVYCETLSDDEWVTEVTINLSLANLSYPGVTGTMKHCRMKGRVLLAEYFVFFFK